jgi:hypothetical protein
MIVATAVGNRRQQEEQKETARAEDTAAGIERQTEEEHPSVFDSMSMDYGGENEGFVFYEIPEEYAASGGYLPEKVQIYTYCLCKQEGVRYALIIAMIERESGYKYDTVGDGGESFGYMQVMQKYHEERMEELGAVDLLNPYQNIRVGVNYMKELIDRYGTIQDALAVYNYGAKGARENLWSNGVYMYSYNEGIMERMKEIEEELGI